MLDCGDTFSRDVTDAAASALAAIVSSVHERLGSPLGLPVLLAGGLLTHHDGLAATTVRAIQSVVPAVKPRVATEPPVAGAVRLALQAASGPPDVPSPLAPVGGPRPIATIGQVTESGGRP